MPVVVYAALVTGDEAKGLQAGFPDLPGVAVSAADSATLIRNAREALLNALHRMEADGAPWPTPTPIERLREGARLNDGLLVLVDATIDDTPVRANISIGERLLKRLDEAAEAQSMTRSGFIAAAVRQRLGEESGPKPLIEGPAAQRLYDEMAAVGRRVNDTLGPESVFGRTLADLDARALEGLKKLSDRFTPALRPKGEAPKTEAPKAEAQTPEA